MRMWCSSFTLRTMHCFQSAWYLLFGGHPPAQYSDQGSKQSLRTDGYSLLVPQEIACTAPNDCRGSVHSNGCHRCRARTSLWGVCCKLGGRGCCGSGLAPAALARCDGLLASVDGADISPCS